MLSPVWDHEEERDSYIQGISFHRQSAQEMCPRFSGFHHSLFIHRQVLLILTLNPQPSLSSQPRAGAGRAPMPLANLTRS